MTTAVDDKVCLPIMELQIHVKGQGRITTALVALDICSTKTYCLKSLSERLGVASSKTRRFNIATVTSIDQNTDKEMIMGMQVSNTDGEGNLDLNDDE